MYIVLVQRMARKVKQLLLLLCALVLVLITVSVTTKLRTQGQVTLVVSSQSQKLANLQWGSEAGLQGEANVEARKRSSTIFNIFGRENRQLKLPDIDSLQMSDEIRDFFKRVVFSNKTHTPPSQQPRRVQRTARTNLSQIRQHDKERFMELIRKLNLEIGINEDGILMVNNSETGQYNYDTDNVSYDQNGVLWKSFGKKHSKHSPLTRPLQGSYILAVDFWDQKIAGLQNILSLQCWTAHLGNNVKVVEPFVIASEFGALPLYHSEPLQTAHLTFGDLYNRSVWNKEASKAKLAQLIEWNEFITTAPPSVILVTLFYADLPSAAGCPLNKLNERTRSLILTYDMDVISEVCINLKDLGHNTTTAEFDALVFGEYDINDMDVTVIFSQWRGITNNDSSRMYLVDSPCRQGVDSSHYISYLLPNIDVMADANTFIGLHYPNRVFFGVMIYMEKIVTNNREGGSMNVLDTVRKCYVKILHDWSSLVNGTKIKSTFLSIDLNVYRSSIFSMHHFKPIHANLSAMTEQVTRHLLGRNMTMEKWDKILDTIASVDDPAYIGLMQTAVAMRSRCIILAGGGPLQDYALRLYKRVHPKRQERCYILLNQNCVRTAHVVPKSLSVR